jgi:hypothetical protein
MFSEFPSEDLKEIRQLPGNRFVVISCHISTRKLLFAYCRYCCDCSSMDTDWACVLSGILLCLECAGKHRSFGINISFVRSIYMDAWTQKQVIITLWSDNEKIFSDF